MLAHQTHSPILPMCITAPEGKVPSAFQKIAVSCGDLILPEELGIEDGNIASYRNAARLVMSRIAEMRERDILALKKPEKES